MVEEHLKEVKAKTDKIVFKLTKLSGQFIDIANMINRAYKSYSIIISNKNTYTSTLEQCIRVIRFRIMFNSKISENVHNEIEELLNIFESYIIANELSEGI